MPTVPGPEAGEYAQMVEAEARKKSPSPEQLLMTAADMKNRGQLYTHATDYSDPRASLKLPNPGGGRGQRHSPTHTKRR